MKHIARLVLLLALVAALLPLSAFAQSSEQQSPSDVPAQAPVVTVQQLEYASPPADVLNDTAISEQEYGAALSSAYASMRNAEAQLKADPTDTHLQESLASAQATVADLIATHEAQTSVTTTPPVFVPVPALVVTTAPVIAPAVAPPAFVAPPPTESDQIMPETSEGLGSLVP